MDKQGCLRAEVGNRWFYFMKDGCETHLSSYEVCERHQPLTVDSLKKGRKGRSQVGSAKGGAGRKGEGKDGFPSKKKMYNIYIIYKYTYI